MYKETKNAAEALEALKFFDWAYKSGGELASSLDYVPLPDTVAKLVEKTWVTSIKSAGKPLWAGK
jgi:phosphate transport system substrate-binding protein